MNELASLVQMAATIAATAVPIVILLRYLAGADENGSILSYKDLPWPRGVQEEDPQPWRFGAVG